MINILLRESDVLFSHSLQIFLTELFSRKFNCTINFRYEFTPETIAHSDIIVMSFNPGERYTCIPQLRARKKGIIIAFVDRVYMSERSPSCFSDVLYLNKRGSLKYFNDAIILAWEKWSVSTVFNGYTSCLHCKCRKMSMRQLQIMSLYYKGMSAKDISCHLRISNKSVFTHKYQVMHKYNLQNELELFLFLAAIADR